MTKQLSSLSKAWILPSLTCFIVPLFESGQISNIHLIDAREEIIMELLFQIGPLDDGISRQ
jgi:hypothetical protein